jgi:hypothetical protein
MATGVKTTHQQDASQPSPVRYEDFIQQRLHYTRRQVKVVDVASGLMILAVGTLAFLLGVAVLDHWVIDHGLGFFSRLLLWLAWVGVAGTYFWLYVLPPLLRRINPIFAAHTIEQSQPSLKNSLINFLLLRGHRQEVPTAVYQAIEHRAAADLSQVQIDSAVDRGRVLHLSYALAVAVAVFALYLAVSPKNPLVSAIRVLWPWSGLAAPTRVAIQDILPGDSVAFHGDTVDISADVTGLRDGETVMLLSSTLDGQVVDQPVAMTRSGEGSRFQCVLPPGNVGLQQDLTYRITAGDATTRPFHIEVQIAPSITVDRVDYHFPKYTEMPDRTVTDQGDVRALEGTVVTIHATANQEIKEAKIDLNCAGLRSLRMKVQGTTATGQFTLGFEPTNPTQPLYHCYQVLFTDAAGRANRRPIRYQVETVRDLPPEVQIVHPQEEDASVAADGQLEIRVRAEDPDFALRRVVLQFEQGGKNLLTKPLLNLVAPAKPWQGPKEEKFAFEPAKLGLKAGDQVKYWAEAFDNKEPTANRAETPPRTIHVVAAQAGGQPAEAPNQPHLAQRPDARQPGDGNRDPSAKDASPREPSDQSPQKPGEGAGQKPDDDVHSKPDNQPGAKPDNPGDKNENPQGESSRSGDNPGDAANAGQNPKDPNQSPGSKSSEQRSDPIDPKTQAGDAFDKILKDKDKQTEKDKQDQPGDKNNKDSSGDKSQSDQQQPGGQSDQKQPGGQSDQKQPGGQSDQKQPGGQSDQKQPGSQSDQKQPGGQSDQKQPGGQSDQKQPGGQSDQKQPGGQSDQKQPGGQSSQKQPGEQGSQEPGGGGQSDQKQPGDGKSGEKQPGGGQSDQKQPGGQGGADTQSSQSGTKSDRKPSGSQGNSDNQAGQGGTNSDNPSNPSESQSPSAPGGQKADPNQKGSPGNIDNPSPEGGTKTDQKPTSDKTTNASSQGGGAQQKPDQPNSSGSPASGSQDKKSGNGQEQKQQPGDGQSVKQNRGNKGGSDTSMRQQAPGKGSGDPDVHSTGSPAPTAEKLPGEQKPENSDGSSPPSKDSSQSPTTSPKDSSTQSDASGDRSGKGGHGGDQPGKKPGAGSSGTHTPTDDGGSVSDLPGEGENGTKAGDRTKAKGKTGSAQKELDSGGEGGHERQQPGPNNSDASKQDSSNKDTPDGHANKEESSKGGQAGSRPSDRPGGAGAGPPTAGGIGGHANEAPTPPPPPDRGEDKANVEFAQKQVDLALNHLKDELAKEKPELLDQLGWSKETAQRFLESWRKQTAAARLPGRQGDAARKSLDEALRGLGLRPHGTQQKGGRTTTDQMQNLRDAGQSDPPGDWADMVRAYTRSTGAGK